MISKREMNAIIDELVEMRFDDAGEGGAVDLNTELRAVTLNQTIIGLSREELVHVMELLVSRFLAAMRLMETPLVSRRVLNTTPKIAWTQVADAIRRDAD